MSLTIRPQDIINPTPVSDKPPKLLIDRIYNSIVALLCGAFGMFTAYVIAPDAPWWILMPWGAFMGIINASVTIILFPSPSVKKWRRMRWLRIETARVELATMATRLQQAAEMRTMISNIGRGELQPRQLAPGTVGELRDLAVYCHGNGLATIAQDATCFADYLQSKTPQRVEW